MVSPTEIAAISSWVVRAMEPDDVPAVAALAAEEPTAPHWPVHEYHRMLAVIQAAPCRRGAWVLADQAGPDTPLGGFSMAIYVAGICELEAVVVRALLRRRRLGSALVGAATGWARSCGGTRIELEVRASNTAALRLYQQLGFATDGRRALYYRNPEEDAVLMSLAL